MKDWFYCKIEVPDKDSKKILDVLEQLGIEQLDDDWCTLKRHSDNAVAEISPCPEPPNRKDNW